MHRLTIPAWLISEQLSAEGSKLRKEWTHAARNSAQSTGTDADGEALLAAAMLRLYARRPSRPLLAQANARALRWVDAAVRRTHEAKLLQRVSPGLRFSQRIALKATQLALPVAACLVLMICKTGLFRLVDGASQVADRLAQVHFDRHIGPPIV